MKSKSLHWGGAVLGLALLSCTGAWAQETPAYQNPKLPVQQRVDDLVGRMTLEQKVGQMVNGAPAIPELGIAQYDWWNEGLHGIARSGYATVFPQAVGMAATWDTPLLGQIGSTVSTEARAKYNQAMRDDVHSIYFGLTVWSPNINIFRDPRWGRGQETYGEDPFLTGSLGVSFIHGLQGDDPKYLKTVATPKHFAVHSGPEPTRHKFNAQPSAHDLEDTYLPAFRMAITEGKAESIMCSYNEIDGDPACANKTMLEKKLRGDWGFKGYVTSDCGAVDDFFMDYGSHYSPDAEHASASALLAGMDLNCGTTYNVLTKAVKDGLVPESAIDTAVKRDFTARFKLGMFDPAADVAYNKIPYTEDDSLAHRALALRTARESIVLLKNEDSFLPLKPAGKTIAVVGPNAASLLALEGNYNGEPSHPVLPLDGIRDEFHGAQVVYAQGSSYVEGLAVPAPRTLFHPSAVSHEEGLKAEYFTSTDLSGKPLVTRVDPQIDFDWNGVKHPVDGISGKAFSVRWSGTITAPAPGDYIFGIWLASCYPCGDHKHYVVKLDGKEVASYASGETEEDEESHTPNFLMKFADTKPHSIEIEYTHTTQIFGAGLTLTWEPPAKVLLDQAVKVAEKSDVVVAVVGLTSNLEGEELKVHVNGFAGGDRTDLGLPKDQKDLLEALGATGKPLVVVMLNGSALAVNWAQEHAKAILEAWYPGEAGGQAIAETLDGKNNPAGRLPLTFYTSVDQLPPFDDYSMKNRTYRYFTGKPLYGFGYGLSYTHFAYSGIRLSTDKLSAGDTLTVSAEVKNTGSREGDEVAELYLTPPKTDVSPIHSLEGFQRIHLAPGQSRRVEFKLAPRQLSQVDDQGVRSVNAGDYSIFVGGQQPEEGKGVSTTFSITGQQAMPK
ncbi:glycoside hydrolase family 3 C-terminal domain-containing protein [Silvibacterium sp.]|uniref:glycoside hydrolase family 3 C-terminal domain-containing protein n=1 Tax=Silvibacterium sp. TaxID=1964179 RepID=UPI0039E324CA